MLESGQDRMVPSGMRQELLFPLFSSSNPGLLGPCTGAQLPEGSQP